MFMWAFLHIFAWLLLHSRGGQAAQELRCRLWVPFVIAQEINPKHLPAPRDIYKPGTVHDIP